MIKLTDEQYNALIACILKTHQFIVDNELTGSDASEEFIDALNAIVEEN